MIWAILPLLAAVGFGAYWMLSRLPLAALAPATVFVLAPFAADWPRLASGMDGPMHHILIVVIVGLVTAAFVYRLIGSLLPEMRSRALRVATGAAGVAASLVPVPPFGQ